MTQRLAHNQYNQSKKDLLYTSPKHQHLHAVKVYAMSDRAGMVVPSDEDTWEGEKSARGWGRRMGLLLSHFLLPLTPNHALTQYSLKSLYTFLKVKRKIKEEEVTKWQYPSSLKTVQVLPTTFLHMLLASCQSLGHDDAKGDGNHVCSCHSGNASLHERSRRKSEHSLHSLQQSICEVLQVSRHSLRGKYLSFSLLDTQDLWQNHTPSKCTQRWQVLGSIAFTGHITSPRQESYTISWSNHGWVPWWFGLCGNPWFCFWRILLCLCRPISTPEWCFFCISFSLATNGEVIIQITPCRGCSVIIAASGCSRVGSLGIFLEVGQLQAFEGNIDVLYPYNSLTKLVSF